VTGGRGYKNLELGPPSYKRSLGGIVRPRYCTAGFECSFVEFCKLEKHFSKCCRRNFFSPIFLFDRAELVLSTCSIKINFSQFSFLWRARCIDSYVSSPVPYDRLIF